MFKSEGPPNGLANGLLRPFLGGLPGRAMDDALDEFVNLLVGSTTTEAVEAGMGAMVTKLDLSKAYDGIYPNQCIRSLRRKGLSKKLTAILRQFYSEREMLFVLKGFASTTTARPMRWLPQGCPICAVASQRGSLSAFWTMQDWDDKVKDFGKFPSATKRQSYIDDRLVAAVFANGQSKRKKLTDKQLSKAHEGLAKGVNVCGKCEKKWLVKEGGGAVAMSIDGDLQKEAMAKWPEDCLRTVERLGGGPVSHPECKVFGAAHIWKGVELPTEEQASQQHAEILRITQEHVVAHAGQWNTSKGCQAIVGSNVAGGFHELCLEAGPLEQAVTQLGIIIRMKLADVANGGAQLRGRAVSKAMHKMGRMRIAISGRQVQRRRKFLKSRIFPRIV